MDLIDAHAHLTDERFEGEVDEVIDRARAAGIEAIVTIGTDIADSRAAVGLTNRFAEVYATVGIHPHSADSAGPESWVELAELAESPRVVAIGETGLDYHYDNSPRQTQMEVFARQLEMARAADLPVVVHAREADDDVARLIVEAGWGRGVLHCFSSSQKLLETALGLGWYVSFAGMITFPKWDQADLLRSIPLDRLLVETDSPYLSPVPHRGKRNEPAFVRLVAERAAELRGEERASLFSAVTDNARAFYRLGSR